MVKKGITFLPRGTVIGGKYEILRVVGTGGMSVVYQVNDTHLNKNWALKEVRKDGIKNYEIVKQGLVVETDMLKKLSHPALPRIVDVIDDEGVFYVVMDFLEGQTLKDVLDKHGAQSQEDVVNWGIQLCQVLNYLHTRRPPIIYRDMKPGNVMLKPEGDVVLFDFGIAREFKEKNVADTTCLGTIGYAAPEQFGNHGQTDPRTDIFCLGATLYHLVTGKNPSDPPYEILPIRKVNPALSSGLEKIILKCTQKNPDDRYQNCAELMYALDNYEHIDVSYRKRLKRRVWAFGISLFVSILGFAGSGISYVGIQREKMHNYATQLTEANDMATQSVYKGEYDPDVMAQFVNTIEIDPSREEAYLRILDYASRTRNTQAGLDVVCSRIDSGTGGIDKNNDVLLRVAQLYFGGNNMDTSFSGDYTQAARYFDKINQETVPEAKYFADLSRALGTFSSSINWDEVNKTLESFVNYNDGQTLDIDKVRNYQLAAGVYTTNKREFQQLKIDPYEKALGLLQQAADGIENLLRDVQAGTGQSTDKEVLHELQKQVIKDIANDYYTGYTIESPSTDFDKAIDYYTQLITLTENEDEIKDIYFRITDITREQGDENKTISAYEDLIRRYSDSAKAYLDYAAYMYDLGDLTKSAELYRKASACKDAEEDPNYERLGIKLRNAGALT